MSAWPSLARELDAWHDGGRTAELWWRDDDATRPGPALDRALDLTAGAGIPLALAVIPARAETDLAARLAGRANVAVLVHGFRHANHAAAEARKAEFGPDRPSAAMIAEIGQGWRRLQETFAAALPVLVPPWNRIDPALVPRLPEAGIGGLSCYTPRAARAPTPGVVQVNTHVDIIDWHGGRGFLGEAAALALIVAHLAARRRGEADATEPTGLLTHHAVHDEPAWRFLANLVEALAGHPAVRWRDARALFAAAP